MSLRQGRSYELPRYFNTVQDPSVSQNASKCPSHWIGTIWGNGKYWKPCFSSGKCRGFLQIFPSLPHPETARVKMLSHAVARKLQGQAGLEVFLASRVGSLKACRMNWSECGNLGQHVQLYRQNPYLREVPFLNALENCRG